jgi:chaperonin cofactor prefoldin
MQIGVSVVLAVVAVYFFLSPVSSNAYKTDVTTLNKNITDAIAGQTAIQNSINAHTTGITQINKDLVDLKNSVNSLSSGIPTQVQTQMATLTSNLASKSDMTSVQSQLTQINSTLSTQNTTLNAKIQTLTDQNTALTTRVTALEAKVVPTANATNNSPIKSYLTVLDKDFFTATNNISNVEIKFTIQNTSASDLTDIAYEIPIYVDYSSAILTSANLTTDGVGTWTIRSQSLHNIKLRNSRLTLLANTKKTIYFTITLQFDRATNGSIEASISDVELISWDYK